MVAHLREQGRANLPALEQIRARLATDGTDRSLVRILDAVLWLAHPDAALEGAERTFTVMLRRMPRPAGRRGHRAPAVACDAGLVSDDRQGRILFHATERATAEAIVRDKAIQPKLDKNATVPGLREAYNIYVATSEKILSAIPHANTVVKVVVPADVTLFEDEGDDPAKGWREWVYQAQGAEDLLSLSDAEIV